MQFISIYLLLQMLQLSPDRMIDHFQMKTMVTGRDGGVVAGN